MEQFVMGMTDFIESLPAIATILFLFFSAVLQQVFPPYPGDSVNIFAGYLCGMGSLNPALAFICFFSGTVISSLLLYEIGRRYGPRIMKFKMLRDMPREKRDNMLKLFNRYGVLYLMACKFLPGVNSVALLLSGVCSMDKRLAYLGITAVAGIHNLFFFYAGRTVGQNWNDVEKFLYSVNRYAIIIVGAAVALACIYILVRNSIKKKREAGGVTTDEDNII